VQAELKDDEEQLVAKASFINGLTPRQILGRYPHRFTDIQAIYRVKRNILERLRHSAAIQALR
jgi:hypothetical protein